MKNIVFPGICDDFPDFRLRKQELYDVSIFSVCSLLYDTAFAEPLALKLLAFVAYATACADRRFFCLYCLQADICCPCLALFACFMRVLH